MHTFLRQTFDDMQAELAQIDSVASHFRVLRDNTDDVAGCGVAVHSEEQVGRGEIEKTQGVGLNDLGAMDEFAQLPGSRGDVHGHDRVAGFG